MRLTSLARSAAALLVGASAFAATAHAQELNGLNSSNQLVTVNAASPSTVLRTTTVTGLGAGQRLVAIDARPATGGRLLYGLSSTGQLYAINPRTGAATAVGAPLAIQGTQFGFDFNPIVDRIRIISNTGQNLRVHPDTAATIVDGTLHVLVGGQRIPVQGNTAAAYTNNVADATTTTLFVINNQTGLLQIQRPPNAGTLEVVGGLGGQAAGTVTGFDISRTGEVRVSVIQGNVTNLFSVNLQTGASTLIGQFGTGVLEGLAFTAAAFTADPALTPNQRAVAGILDNFTAVGPGFAGLLNTLDLLPAAQRADAFAQLSPVPFGILPQTVLQTNEFVDGSVRSYLQDVRHGRTVRADGAFAERGLGGFLVATGRVGDFRARGDRLDMRYGAVGVIGAVDMRLGANGLVGITGGYDEATVRLNPISQNSRAKTWFVGGYGSAGFGPIFVDVAGTYGRTDFDLRRDVAFSGFRNQGTSETNARYYSLSAVGGVNLSTGAVAIEPYAGGRYVDVSVRPFSEGAALTNLSVGRQNVESLQSILGVKASVNLDAGGAIVRPSIRGEYRHEFRNDETRSITSSFAGSGINTPFTTTSEPMGDDYFVVGAGFTISGGGPVGLTVDYTGQIRGGFDIHGLQIGMLIRL